MKFKLLAAALMLLLPGCAGKTVDHVRTPAGAPLFDSCLSKEEAELAAIINKGRTDRGLHPVSVTGSLHEVAKWHVIDLAMNEPHLGKTDGRGKPCTPHSWSDRGKEQGGWNALCYTADHRYSKGMWSKPREISGYRADGYENIYFVAGSLSPAIVLTKWESDPATETLLYEKGLWKNSNWKSMGVGIHGSYASIWFGSRTDEKGVLAKCPE